MSKSRLKANRELVSLISQVVEIYPDWRFQQILWNLGVSDGTDKFHEEPEVTLEKVKKVMGLDK